LEGKTFTIDGERVTLECAKYDNGRLAIRAMAEDGIPYAVLTVNLPDADLEPGEFFVKTWSENEGIAAAAISSGLFKDTGKRVATGWVEAQIWRIHAQ
jgi:hypothetical protein